jgi:UDP-3-O-[3-hydroxymyristoyl] glucosamine N-acyltransferase
MKLREIATELGARIESGSPDLEIRGVAGLEHAGAGELAFVANPKYAALAKTTAASAIIVGDEFPALGTPLLRCKNPYLAFARALELFY